MAPDTTASIASPTNAHAKHANADIELHNVASGSYHSIPLEEDIMQLARLGEIGAIQRLFASGKFDAKYKDEEGITPLHWAAINNQYTLCEFLLDAGAEVNAKGGEAMATPAMWAAQQCRYYVVNLLLERGADPLLADIQGYNILHLATFDGNAFLLVPLLYHDIPIDIPDPQGHTCLMWAAYRGYPAVVDLFLRRGASVAITDDAGFTPLHWALVRGSLPCVQKLVEYGADLFAKTNDGKTPAIVAEELKTRVVWHKALRICGFDQHGQPLELPFGPTRWSMDKQLAWKFFFTWPAFMVLLAIWLLSVLPIYFGVPIAILSIFAMQACAIKMAGKGTPEFSNFQRTPFLAGVFAGSLFWVGVRFVTTILPNTYAIYPFLSLSFAVSYMLVTFFFFRSMTEDPGFVPKLQSKNQQKAVITELINAFKFDEKHFCVNCMVRKPLRSKHCKHCKRCVSKHDHHCPWIDNCVGVNNLRHFVLYVFSLEVGLMVYIHLAICYINLLPSPMNPICTFLSPPFCDLFSRDRFTILLTLWTTLQLIWITMLCVVQSVQIARNETTYEKMRGFVSYYPSDSFPGTVSPLSAGATSTPPNVHSYGHRRIDGFCGRWKKLIGLDTFLATAAESFDSLDRRARAGVPRNPFSQGILANCRDFWCDDASLFGKRESGSGVLAGDRVNYHRMYEIPVKATGGMIYRAMGEV